MHQNRRKKLITVLLAGFFVLLSGLLSGCSGGPVSASGDPGPGAEDAAANTGSVHSAASAGDILITEIMGRNHATLQDHPSVTTRSEGEEPYRRVIITLK